MLLGECQCGRKVDWHSRYNIRESSDATWDADKHTVTEDCTSFGSVQFLGFDKEGSKNEAMVGSVVVFNYCLCEACKLFKINLDCSGLIVK
jgi:hypothetical protein